MRSYVAAILFAAITLVGCTEEHYHLEGTPAPSPPSSGASDSTDDGSKPGSLEPVARPPHPEWMLGTYDDQLLAGLDAVTYRMTLTADGWASFSQRKLAKEEPSESAPLRWRINDDGYFQIGENTFVIKASAGCRVVSINGNVYSHVSQSGTCPTKADRLTEAEERLVGGRGSGQGPSDWASIQMDVHRYFYYQRKTASTSRVYVGTFRVDDAGTLHVVVPTGEEIFRGRVTKTADGYTVCVDGSCADI
jgi:hypothetical protein